MTERQKYLSEMANRLAMAIRGQNVKLDQAMADSIQNDLEGAWKTLKMATAPATTAPVAG